MGQQQLLLIILGVIIVGIAVAGGISLFKSQAMGQNRDAVWADLMQLGARAQSYYRRPSSLGGGGYSFIGFALSGREMKNDNGTYNVSTTSVDEVQIQGTGTEIGNDDENLVTLLMVIRSDTMYVDESTNFN